MLCHIEVFHVLFPVLHIVLSSLLIYSYPLTPLQGWDKRFCLQFLEPEAFEEIHFFGDKTWEGGNDYEIFEDERTIGHTVVSPEDTMKQCTDLFMA
jgi:phosphomannomutase